MFFIALLLAGGLASPSPSASAPQDAAAPAATAAQTHPSADASQDDADEKKPPTPLHTGIHALFRNLGDDFKHLPSTDNLYVALIGGGLAAAVHPADATFNIHLRSHDVIVNAIYKPAHTFGDTPEQMAMSLGTYAYGRIFDAPKVSHLGMDLLRAQILTEAMVEPLKFATRRERPDLSNNQSFPSGHAAVTFAAATVIERHLGWKRSLLGYAVASYVASSRLHDNRHYLSDVVFGAAVGTIAGRTITQHGSDVWTFGPVNVPGGVAIVVARTRWEL